MIAYLQIPRQYNDVRGVREGHSTRHRATICATSAVTTRRSVTDALLDGQTRPADRPVTPDPDLRQRKCPTTIVAGVLFVHSKPSEPISLSSVYPPSLASRATARSSPGCDCAVARAAQPPTYRRLAPSENIRGPPARPQS